MNLNEIVESNSNQEINELQNKYQVLQNELKQMLIDKSKIEKKFQIELKNKEVNLIRLTKNVQKLENENTKYQRELVDAYKKIRSYNEEKNKKDQEVTQALMVYKKFNILKMDLDSKNRDLNRAINETNQQRQEYENKKDHFETELAEIKKGYSVLLKLILIIFVPVVVASILTNIDKTRDVFDFFYTLIRTLCKGCLAMTTQLNIDKDISILITAVVLFLVFILFVWLVIFFWRKLKMKTKEKSKRIGYRDLDNTYFLPTIFFSEFVVVVYVNLFSFIPINSFGIYLIVLVCTYILYLEYISGRLHIFRWKKSRRG